MRKPKGYDARDRYLDEDEMRALWAATDRPVDADWVVRLLLLTGARVGEIAGMRWDEIDLVTSTWTLPAERAKNGEPLVLTLPPAAMDIIRSIPRAGERPHLFGRRGSGFTSMTVAKRELDRRLGDAVAPFRLHDLRRTCATGMAALGVLPNVVSAVLNHAGARGSGVTATYNQHRYAKEITAALARWAAFVTGANNVAPVRAVAG